MVGCVQVVPDALHAAHLQDRPAGMLLGTLPTDASLGPTVTHGALHWHACIGWCRTAVGVAFKAIIVVFGLALAWAAALLLPPLGHLDCGV
jgi:hypothetical protein